MIRYRKLGYAALNITDLARALRMVEPVTGVTLDFYGSGGMQQADDPFSPSVTHLESICHVGIGTPHYREAIDFYERLLNFKTSDEIDGRIRLMRAFPNPLHHSLAIAHAGRNSLHHINFMVRDDDDLMCARTRFEGGGRFASRRQPSVSLNQPQ